METLFRDIRYGVRSLLKRPGFTAIALVALALGIGANTAIFSLVNAVLLRPLPFAEPDRLVWMWGNIRGGGNRASVSPLDFLDYRNQNTTFEEFAASISVPVHLNLTGSGEPERLNAAGVTGNYFQALGTKPALGRTFLLENEKTGSDQVTVLSYALWQKRFAGDPNIVNKTVTLDGKTCPVLGVMPQNFNFPQSTELWVPLNFDVSPGMKQRKAHFLRPIGRLKAGVTMAQAQADTDAIARRLEEQYPEDKSWNLRLVSLREQLVGNTRPTLFILFGAVGFVLLIACANVANLLLVRAAGRQKEIALRTALGAGRLTILRQMITESVLLALAGGAAGTLLAVWGVALLVALSAGNIPSTAQVRIDSTVLVFTLLISLATGVLFGLVPALRTIKLNLSESLKEGGRSGSDGARRNRTRSVLVVLESAVAVVLLIGAGLLVRSLLRLQDISPGFDANNVLTMRLDLPEAKYGTPEKSANFFSELESRLDGLPGVESVGFISELPLSGQPNDMPYTVEGRPPVSIDQSFDDDFRQVNRQYFSALRIPLLRGRYFTDQDVRQNAKVVIISDLLARQTFPNEDPVGKRLIFMMGKEPFEIIGIVGDIRHRALESAPAPAIYLPNLQTPWMNVVIRTKGDPSNLSVAVRKVVQGIDPDQPVADVRTMQQWVDEAVAGPRYRTTLLGLFALVALLLASTGIYGVMSYSVSQRTHEIGVRMALGARQLDVLKLVVRQGMVLVVVGVGIGLMGALALTRLMSSLLFGVTAKDPFTFVAVAALLTFVAFVACYLPARRATKVDPLTALRYE